MLLSDGDTHMLVDAGISTRRIRMVLQQFGLSVRDLDGVLLTHEHGDHISGLATFVKHYHTPLYVSPGTARQLHYRIVGTEPLLQLQLPGSSFRVGDCLVTSFATSHDTVQSVGYRVDGSGSVGILTDTGYVTEAAERVLPGVDTLVLESNYDPDLLRMGPYPYQLQMRIRGPQGHLSNNDAAEFAVKMAASGTRRILLAHLSRENNTPQLAWETVNRALRHAGADVELDVLPYSELSPGYQVGAGVCRK